MPFKMKGWSPFNQFAGSQEKDIVGGLEKEKALTEEPVLADVNKKMQLQKAGMKAMVRKIESVTNVPTDRIHNVINRLKAKGITPSSEQVIEMLSEMGTRRLWDSND